MVFSLEEALIITPRYQDSLVNFLCKDRFYLRKEEQELSAISTTSFGGAFFQQFLFNKFFYTQFKELIELAGLPALVLFGDVAKHVRMNIQADVCHIVKMLTSDKPDDLADFTL